MPSIPALRRQGLLELCEFEAHISGLHRKTLSSNKQTKRNKAESDKQLLYACTHRGMHARAHTHTQNDKKNPYKTWEAN